MINMRQIAYKIEMLNIRQIAYYLHICIAVYVFMISQWVADLLRCEGTKNRYAFLGHYSFVAMTTRNTMSKSLVLMKNAF